MQEFLLAYTFISTIGLSSCPKEKTVTVHDTTTIAISIWSSGKINADTLSEGLKLANSTIVEDSVFPAATATDDTPGLNSPLDGTHIATKGGLLTIYPTNTSGFVQGYYVQIVGAKSYFKVDYGLSEEIPLKVFNKYEGVRGNGTGHIDSVLAFQLPAGVNGDTFYVKYAAYDKNNLISQPTIATVVLLPIVSNSIADSLKGSWRLTGYKDYSNGQLMGDWGTFEPYDYNESYYKCESGVEGITPGNAEDGYPRYATRRESWYAYSFDGKSLHEQNGYIYSDLDLAKSNCDVSIYNRNNNNENLWYDRDAIGYTYDAKSGRITIYAAHSSEESSSDIYTNTYKISSLNDQELILLEESTGNSSNSYFMKFTKQ